MIADIGRCKLFLTFGDLQHNLPAGTMRLKGQHVRGVLGVAGRCQWPFGDPHLSLKGKVGSLWCHWELLLSCFFPKWRDLGDTAAPVVFACCSPRGALLEILHATHKTQVPVKAVIHTMFRWHFLYYRGDKSRLKNLIVAENRDNCVFPTQNHRRVLMCCLRFGTGLNLKSGAGDMWTTWIKAEEHFPVIPCET